MSAAHLRQLGTTDYRVPAIGLGGMGLTNRGFVGGVYQASLDQTAATAVIRSALGAGTTWFDTAEIYGRGQVDATLATALTEVLADPSTKVTAEQLLIATKWNPIGRPASSIGRRLSAELRAVGAPILHQIHYPYGSLSPLDKQLKAMVSLHRAGKIHGVGVSNFNAHQMVVAHKILAEHSVPLVSNQVRLSLLRRDVESNGVLATAKELGITLIAYFPLASGILTGKFHEHPDQIPFTSVMRRRASGLSRATIRRTQPLIDELHRIGNRYGATPAQVALNWVISNYGDTVVAIPGATNPYHALDNARATAFELDPAERATLTELSTRCAAGGARAGVRSTP